MDKHKAKSWTGAATARRPLRSTEHTGGKGGEFGSAACRLGFTAGDRVGSRWPEADRVVRAQEGSGTSVVR